jgi:tetratricopeptide (TPR) repeat protein
VSEHHADHSLDVRLQQLTAGAGQLLEILCWLAPEPVPLTALACMVDADARREQLAELESRRFVELDGTAFSVDRAVQELLRQQQAEKTPPVSLTLALAWMAALWLGKQAVQRLKNPAEPLLPHLRAVALHGDERGIAHPTAALLKMAGVAFQVRREFETAEHLLRRALAVCEAEGRDDGSLAEHLNNLAMLLHRTGRPAEAEPLMRRALAIDEARYGNAHPFIVCHLDIFSPVLLAVNRGDEAETMMRRALAIDESARGAEHPDTAERLMKLAYLLIGTKRPAEAVSPVQRALHIYVRLSIESGEPHPRLLAVADQCAALLAETGNTREQARGKVDAILAQGRGKPG